MNTGALATRTARRVGFASLSLYTLVLLTATHWPQSVGPALPSNDKLMHLGAYFVWTSLTLFAWRPRRAAGALWITLSACALGAVDEVTQGIPGINRSTEFLDWLADAAGATLALAFWAALQGTRAARADNAGECVQKSDA